MQDHADIAGDILLGVLDESVHRLLERRVPLGLVHQLAPRLFELTLVAVLHALEGDGLEGLVGLNERDGSGSLVNFA